MFEAMQIPEQLFVDSISPIISMNYWVGFSNPPQTEEQDCTRVIPLELSVRVNELVVLKSEEAVYAVHRKGLDARLHSHGIPQKKPVMPRFLIMLS